jgi:hypothetical protein
MQVVRLNRQEIEKLIKFYKQFPDSKYFWVEESDSNGIGTVGTVRTETIIDGAKGMFSMELFGVDDW